MNERDKELDRKLDAHLAALRDTTADTPLRPGMAARALAAARESESDFWSKLLRAARFEIPALAAVAAAALILAGRAQTATPPTTASATTTSTATQQAPLFPADDSADTWATWAYESDWDSSLWGQQDG